MNNKKQSSIDFLLDKLPNSEATWLSIYVAQAKAMHRKEIEEAFDFGDYNIDLPDGTWEQKYKSPEQYYNETFGGQDNE